MVIEENMLLRYLAILMILLENYWRQNKIKDIIIEEVLMKRVVRSGNSSHIVLPKRLDDKLVYVLVILEGIVKPKFHYKRKKTYMGKTYYQAEITDNAGTHAIWIEKDKIKEIFKR